jgi:hypothetical protein
MAGLFGQEKPTYKTLDFSTFYGSILPHNSDISHLIRGHPTGGILSLNNRTFGSRPWHQDFGYPDWGFSAIFQDMSNPELGFNFGIYAHLNAYFLRRNVQLRMGQGIAYNSNPYDRLVNFRNNAYGSQILSSTYFLVQLQKERLFGRFGIATGVGLIHYSNGNVRAPNTSTNTFILTAGLTYDPNPQPIPEFKQWTPLEQAEPIHVNVMFRTGVNESDVIGSGQFPFYIASIYADKRVGRLSGFQIGTDIFFSHFLKELIRFKATSFPELQIDRNSDYRRVGMFAGHELFMGKLSVITQLGYYVYYPFDFEGRVYNRIGAQRTFGEHFLGGISLKSHGAKAEAVEFGLGYRW